MLFWANLISWNLKRSYLICIFPLCLCARLRMRIKYRECMSGSAIIFQCMCNICLIIAGPWDKRAISINHVYVTLVAHKPDRFILSQVVAIYFICQFIPDILAYWCKKNIFCISILRRSGQISVRVDIENSMLSQKRTMCFKLLINTRKWLFLFVKTLHNLIATPANVFPWSFNTHQYHLLLWPNTSPIMNLLPNNGTPHLI